MLFILLILILEFCAHLLFCVDYSPTSVHWVQLKSLSQIDVNRINWFRSIQYKYHPEWAWQLCFYNTNCIELYCGVQKGGKLDSSTCITKQSRIPVIYQLIFFRMNYNNPTRLLIYWKALTTNPYFCFAVCMFWKLKRGKGKRGPLNFIVCWHLHASISFCVQVINGCIVSKLGDSFRAVEASERIGVHLWLRCRLALFRSLAAHISGTAAFLPGLFMC